ncbi:MAG: MFS transporter [Pseudomonadota bacterium]
MRLRTTRAVVAALGTGQTIAYASSYYLPAVLATPMARDLGLSTVWVFAGFSVAMIVSALVGPLAGRMIDRNGGGWVLVASNLIFAVGLIGLAVCSGPVTLCLAWVVIGIGMGCGLYEAAFATLAGIYGRAARSPITGITLIAGFASTVGWPLSGVIEAQMGWRVDCLAWALIHLIIALPLNLALPPAVVPPPVSQAVPRDAPPASRLTFWLLAWVFAATWFTSTAMAAHLPRLLEAAGASSAMAIAAGALIGPAQVAARLFEFGILSPFHPLLSARLAALTHPVGAAALLMIGGPAAYAFAVLHGAGNGVLTIAKGTLPLAIFGPAGYGLRQGLLNAPARILQAFAPLLFGFALERWGASAVWLTTGISLSAFAALMVIRKSGTGD